LINLEAVAPSFVAIMSLMMFTPQTRWYCYAVVVMAISTELIPLSVNVTALLVCVSCLIALFFSEFLRVINITHPFPGK
jgi:hypothetical protein